MITQFGEPIGDAITQPGLHVKLPFAQDVNVFDKRWLEWTGNPNQVPTRDKKYIWVETYARWRIANPLLFFQRLRDERGAQSRLDDIIDGETRNVIASHNLIEVVRVSNRAFERAEDVEDVMETEAMRQVELGRHKITRLILERASKVMPDYGIELVDVQIQRVNYIESVQTKVFERMISERKRIADRHRSEGQGKSAEIRGKKERELKVIESEAYRKTQEIMGRGDAEATGDLRRRLQPGSRALPVRAHDGHVPRDHRQEQLAGAVDRRRPLPVPAVRWRGGRGAPEQALTFDREPDPYAVLDVARSASPAEIKAAYQTLAGKYHPDLHQGNPLEDLASERLAEINRAYEMLSDATRRAAYDAGGPSRPARARADLRTNKRLLLVASVIVLVPLVVRLGAVVIRAVASLARTLFAAAASIPGGRPAAVTLLALPTRMTWLLGRASSPSSWSPWGAQQGVFHHGTHASPAPGSRDHPDHARGGRRDREAGHAVFDREGQRGHAAHRAQGLLPGGAPVSAAPRRHHLEVQGDVRHARPHGARVRDGPHRPRESRGAREGDQPVHARLGRSHRRLEDAGAQAGARQVRLRRRVRGRPARRGEIARQGARVLVPQRRSTAGIRRTSARSCGASTTRASTRGNRSASFPCRTGPSSTSGNTSTWRRFRSLRSTTARCARWSSARARSSWWTTTGCRCARAKSR